MYQHNPFLVFNNVLFNNESKWSQRFDLPENNGLTFQFDTPVDGTFEIYYEVREGNGYRLFSNAYQITGSDTESDNLVIDRAFTNIKCKFTTQNTGYVSIKCIPHYIGTRRS